MAEKLLHAQMRRAAVQLAQEYVQQEQAEELTAERRRSELRG